MKVKLRSKKKRVTRSTKTRGSRDIVVGIDPGIVTYGIAILDASNTSTILRSMSGTVTQRYTKETQILTATTSIVHAMWMLINSLKGTQVKKKGTSSRSSVTIRRFAVEMPELFRGAKGHAASSLGHTFSIAAVAGALIYHADDYFEDCDCKLYHPKEWKGQLSKDATISRVMRKLNASSNKMMKDIQGKRKTANHHWDAAGIALHSVGAF